MLLFLLLLGLVVGELLGQLLNAWGEALDLYLFGWDAAGEGGDGLVAFLEGIRELCDFLLLFGECLLVGEDLGRLLLYALL